MMKTVLRLGPDTRIEVTDKGTVHIEQGQYMDTDPDFARAHVELSRREMRRLVEVWLHNLMPEEEQGI